MKINYLAGISYFKKTLKAFPGEESLLKVFRLALLLKEEPCPLCLQMVFFK